MCVLRLLGASLQLPTLIINNICDKDTGTLSTSHTHLFVYKVLCCGCCVCCLQFCLLQVQQVVIHCAFLVVSIPHIYAPPCEINSSDDRI